MIETTEEEVAPDTATAPEALAEVADAPVIKAPSISVSDKVRPAIPLSEEEISALAPREDADMEANFRARFLSSRPTKPISVN